MGQIDQELIAVIIRRIESLGATAVWNQRKRILLVNQELRAWILFIRHNVGPSGQSFWLIDRHAWVKPDITVAVRMDQTNTGILDYYLFPEPSRSRLRMRLGERNGMDVDAYRFATPDFLVGMAARVKLAEGVWVILARHSPTLYGTPRWWLRRRPKAVEPDVTLVVRMDRGNERILDYYLLPGIETLPPVFQLGGRPGLQALYGFKTLDVLVGMAARTQISRAL